MALRFSSCYFVVRMGNVDFAFVLDWLWRAVRGGAAANHNSLMFLSSHVANRKSTRVATSLD